MKRLVVLALLVTTFVAPASAHASDPGFCKPAHNAVLAVGGTKSEAQFAGKIAWRESGCTLRIHGFSTRTRDDSWGPWQINYYGRLRSTVTKLIGPPKTNIQSWNRAAKNFLKLLHKEGRCAWQAPRYCYG